MLSILAVAAAVAIYYQFRPENELLKLRDLPEVTPEVVAAQGQLFRVEEPILYNCRTKVATFVVEILSVKNFDDETRLVFGGDARSLQSFVNEIRLVNASPSRVGGFGDGMADGLESIISGLSTLIFSPLETLKRLWDAGGDLVGYWINTSSSQKMKDAADAADAFYVDLASTVAEKHEIDYFDLKTEHAKATIHIETNSRLTGKATIEIASLLVPFLKLKVGAEASKVGEAAKMAKVTTLATKMVDAGKLSPKAAQFARVSTLFPIMAAKMAATLERMEFAEASRRFVPPIATLGKAASQDYRATFLARNPQLEGLVVVHHAIEQQVLTRYPGLLSEAEIHSLENLRGIPKNLDSTLHKSFIAKEWNRFYENNPASTMTKQKLLDKATEIDRQLGHLFTPKLL